MHNVFLIFLFLVSLVNACGAEPSLIAPTNLLKDPAGDSSWKDLFSQLAPSKTRYSLFEEKRQFPFRRTPSILSGEIRIAPDRGLSLHYMEPDSRIMIVDARGLLMRDDKGHERTAPADGRAQAATGALINVLRFDIPALEKTFSIYGSRDGDRWAMAFVPRDSALASTIGTLAVHGEGAALRTIEISRSSNQRIDITIRETKENVVFSPDELRQFFR